MQGVGGSHHRIRASPVYIVRIELWLRLWNLVGSSKISRQIQSKWSETTVCSIRERENTLINGRAICNMINHHKLPVAA